MWLMEISIDERQKTDRDSYYDAFQRALTNRYKMRFWEDEMNLQHLSQLPFRLGDIFLDHDALSVLIPLELVRFSWSTQSVFENIPCQNTREYSKQRDQRFRVSTEPNRLACLVGFLHLPTNGIAPMISLETVTNQGSSSSKRLTCYSQQKKRAKWQHIKSSQIRVQW